MNHPKVYLHWSATGYDWRQPGHYHSIVSGDAVVFRMHDYNIDLHAHTYGRNTNSVAIACACMGGEDPWQTAPKAQQLDAMCQEAARLIKLWGWKEADITVKNIMTHAEAAANRDGEIRHDNYGPTAWGGSGERWDLMRLERNGSDDGGDQLRAKILAAFVGSSPISGRPGSAPGHPLEGSTARTISVLGKSLAVLIDVKGTTWAKVADLLSAYAIPFIWDAQKRRILLGSANLIPRYTQDQVVLGSGLPGFEMALQGQASPVILVGLIYQGKAYCRVLEFADELGISATFNPLSLHQQRGG